MRTRGLLVGINETLGRMDQTLARMDDRMERNHAELVQESRLTRAAVHNNGQVTREVLLELRDHRPILERIDHGVHANTEGLLHVLDELRNGPDPAGA